MEEKNPNFVDALVKDPANPPQVKLLVGYVGKSNAPGHVRIYTDPELSEHIDVPEASVLHTKEVPNDPLGAKFVWVQKDADITHRDLNRTELKSRFLAGPIVGGAADLGTGGLSAANQAPQRPVASVNVICPTPSFNPAGCPPQPSFLGNCPTIDICPTQVGVCTTHIPAGCPAPSIIALCPSQPNAVCPGNTSFLCPTRLGNCPVTLLQCPVTRPIDCIVRTAFCPTRVVCPSRGFCPSAVDACPSAMCLPGGLFNPLI